MSATETREKTRNSEDLRAHFSLHETPFTREIAVQDRWVAPHLEEPRAELRRTIEQRQSGAIIAPAGSGSRFPQIIGGAQAYS